ncbi:MAG: hypothetical protein RLZZ453_1065 [Chlamydiota bacterium]|jgi:lipoate-protein ligase A
MEWIIKDTGVDRAQTIMQFDAELLEKADALPGPCIHFYEWERPSITYGYFIRPEKLLDMAAVERLGIDIARRPTGGGVVFHMFDMAFSVVVPAHTPWFSQNTLDNYALINAAVLRAVEQFLESSVLELTPEDAIPKGELCSNFCMARPTKFDVMRKGRKVAGAAQRKTKKGFLHQGMIALVAPDESYLRQILKTDVVAAMQEYTAPLVRGDLKEAKSLLKEFLSVQLKQALVSSPHL